VVHTLTTNHWAFNGYFYTLDIKNTYPAGHLHSI